MMEHSINALSDYLPATENTDFAPAYNLRSRKGDHFPIENKKNEQNTFLQERIKLLDCMNSCLVLDAETLGTTRMLVDGLGVDPRSIIIPNKFSYHPTGRAARKSNLAVRIVNSSSADLISSIDQKKCFSFIYLDYTSTLSGSKKKKCHPDQEIPLIFSKKLLCDNSVFAVTLVRRDRVYSSSMIDKACEIIRSSMSENGYKLKALTTQCYKSQSGSNMVLLTAEIGARKPNELSIAETETATMAIAKESSKLKETEEITEKVLPNGDRFERFDSKARAVYRGPKGGLYYINRNGNKTYVKK
eukprot:TRINITY_DN27385_c1_g1_i1.p1 TRINITY_DN27385_c1_g1~~TRINITY_DN27385_c1_g1_i1.p1  ORF type:complete len:302 (+),score=-14.60 TRINITY_DN27385_c1_g1_i1:189-1094(+)